jgi:phosphate starvation-inducible PhoH-like protein
METEKHITETINFDNREKSLYIVGKDEANLPLVSKEYEVSIVARDRILKISGKPLNVAKAIIFFNELLISYDNGIILNKRELKNFLKNKADNKDSLIHDILDEKIEVYSSKKYVYTKTSGQKNYVKAIKEHDIVFSIGPAGTGKTYLAVAMAVAYLKAKKIGRIILSRPAIEAGETLGFLPGDLKEKISPFLTPLYDALYEMIGYDTVYNFLEKKIIEISPLAYMRGRTLNDSFIILDEAQNTTSEQMKMFLTRLGFNSKVVITGDITQIDLHKSRTSGLIEVQSFLHKIKGISFIYLQEKDIVRHQLVQKIVKAYEKEEGKKKGKRSLNNEFS